MYNRILVPMDRSKRAEAILPHVEELAQRYDAKVIFLQVIESPSAVVAFEERHLTQLQQEFELQERQVKDYLTGLQTRLREKGIETRQRLGQGPVVEEIIKAAEQEGADLIAIASHGRGGLSRVFYGSVAAGVLQRIDRPLLLIRSRGDE